MGNAANAAARKAVSDRNYETFITADHHMVALRDVMKNLIPKKALQRVKRSMRREMRKPADMKIRTYFQHLIRINLEELPNLPPFEEGQTLKDDEIVDIILYAVPKSWNKEADRQGFDPMEHTAKDLVDFLEQIEMAEDFDGEKVVVDSKKKGNGKKNPSNTNKGKYGTKYCMIHGEGGHTTDDCHTVKAKLGKNSSGNPNKSWSRKADDAKKKTAKDLKSYVKKAIREEVHAITKKRKTAELDMNALEKEFEDIDLSQFDEDDLMKGIESDSENGNTSD